MSLANRLHRPELMDSLDIDTVVHKQALHSLGRLNAISLSSQIVWPTLRELAKAKSIVPLRVLDLACGGGDMVCRLGRWARRAGLNIEWHGLDRSPLAVQLAGDLAARDCISANFEVADVLHDQLPGRFDVVMCSTFLHHLSECDVVKLLLRMSQVAKQTVLVNDLYRTNGGYLLTWLGCYLLTRSYICRVDGPRSVAGAFTEQEVLGLAARAGCSNPRITRHWPLRFLLRWDQM